MVGWGTPPRTPNRFLVQSVKPSGSRLGPLKNPERRKPSHQTPNPEPQSPNPRPPKPKLSTLTESLKRRPAPGEHETFHPWPPQRRRSSNRGSLAPRLRSFVLGLGASLTELLEFGVQGRGFRSLRIHPSIQPASHPPIYLSVCLSVGRSIYRSIDLSIYLSVYLY